MQEAGGAIRMHHDAPCPLPRVAIAAAVRGGRVLPLVRDGRRSSGAKPCPAEVFEAPVLVLKRMPNDVQLARKAGGCAPGENGGTRINSHARRHSATDAPLPRLYRPAEIAEALGCSEWWVKEQARQRRIPFTRLGGAYRFTTEHFTEIVRVFEERPLQSQEPKPEGPVQPPSRRLRRGAPASVRLRAKRPRRANRPEPPLAAA
ncbi:helix-turn-helix domain-containing protein [Streptomyces olivoreticuli]